MMTAYDMHPEDAKEWMEVHARPLEMARYRYLFEEGPVEDVYAALVAYQNEDGGFGQGLEPDFTYPGSTAIASWSAARILFEIKAASDRRIVQRLIKYLIETQDKSTGMWATTVPKMNDYSHAPWWMWSEEAQQMWQFNPGVELAAYCIHWSEADPDAASAGWFTIRQTVKRLKDAKEMDFHELSNYQHALKIIGEDLKDESLGNMLNERIHQSVEKDPVKWGQGYQALPLDFISNPEDLRALGMEKDLVEAQICYWQASRLNEGIWDIDWDWGQYPEAFEKARREWQGILAVERYNKLRNLQVD